MNPNGLPRRAPIVTQRQPCAKRSRRIASLAAAALLFVSGCAVVGEDENSSLNDTAFPPLAVLVPPDKVMRAAEQFAKQHPTAFVFLADGQDTLPRYAAGTALVVEPGRYRSLLRGSTVVLRTPENGPVVHVLTAKTPTGWTARGFKGPNDDIQTMTASNYLGTVIMVFTPRT